MKALKSLAIATSLLAVIPIVGAQNADTGPAAQIPTDGPAADLPPAGLPSAPAAPPADLPAVPESGAAAPDAPPVETHAAPATPFAPLEQQKSGKDEGVFIKDAALNDIFQYLSKSAGRQYFHNAKINGTEYLVTGHLTDGNPLQQMEELAFMYGLTLHVKGNTIYALTQAQLAQLPSAEFHYQLRYMRPTDIAVIKELIKPVLTPGTGIVNFEPKTNTIIIIDSAHRIEQARQLLRGIDKPQGQIIVETKILRVNSSAAKRTGVDWNASLGSSGTSLRLATSLNALFGIESLWNANPLGAAESILNTQNLVLSPIQLSGVLRALAEGKYATQLSNPTLITEDNEQASISIIDRIPIITTTSTQATNGGNPTVTEEVRYKIDASDQSIDASPDKHREIGISLVVTPTLLPDGTIRMKMRPRSAQVVAEITSLSGNKYPRVSESMIETLARIPDGYSLIVGGFYGESDSNDRNKVPLLGDIPVLNFFFKSKESIRERASLVFIVTPKSYSPAKGYQSDAASARLRAASSLDCDYNWVDSDNPGPAHEPNLRRAIRDLQPTEAPYYPRAEKLSPAPHSQPVATPGSPRFSHARRR